MGAECWLVTTRSPRLRGGSGGLSLLFNDELPSRLRLELLNELGRILAFHLRHDDARCSLDKVLRLLGGDEDGNGVGTNE